jgi:hypothetical protein
MILSSFHSGTEIKWAQTMLLNDTIIHTSLSSDKHIGHKVCSFAPTAEPMTLVFATVLKKRGCGQKKDKCVWFSARSFFTSLSLSFHFFSVSLLFPFFFFIFLLLSLPLLYTLNNIHSVHPKAPWHRSLHSRRHYQRHPLRSPPHTMQTPQSLQHHQQQQHSNYWAYISLHRYLQQTISSSTGYFNSNRPFCSSKLLHKVRTTHLLFHG